MCIYLEEIISVIIPVYNVDKYLEECLTSVSRQTYTNLEIIMVDDGSNDLSGEICEQWCKKDSRFHVIHKENNGLSSARNAGLRVATGEFIAFVDSDDVIHCDMLLRLYEIIAKTQCSICCCDVEQGTVFKDTEEIGEESLIKMYTPEQAFREIIEGTDVFITVWNKLYKKDAIEGIYFPEGRCHEDEFWSCRVIDRAVRIASVNRKLYGYRQRENSIMNSRYSVRRLDLLDARVERQQIFERQYPELVRLGKCDLRFECIRAQQFSLLYMSEEEKEKSRKRIQKIICRYPVKFSDCSELPIRRRVWYLLSGITFIGTCQIRNWFHFGP